MSHGPFDRPKGKRERDMFSLRQLSRLELYQREKGSLEPFRQKEKDEERIVKRSRGVKDLRTFPAGMFSLIPGFLGGGASIFLPFHSCLRVLVSRTWKWKWVWLAKMVVQTTNRCSLIDLIL